MLTTSWEELGARVIRNVGWWSMGGVYTQFGQILVYCGLAARVRNVLSGYIWYGYVQKTYRLRCQ